MNDGRTGAMTFKRPSAPVRGTQLLVEHMGSVFHRPLLVGIEVLWRWLLGVPFLWICWTQLQAILAAYPLQSSGFYALDTGNPWVATVQLAGVWAYYEPHVFAVLRWLLPAFAGAWILASALGRHALLRKMEPGFRLRLSGMVIVQAAWVGLFALTVFGWFRSMQWVAARHFTGVGEPDLVGYSIWAIFLALAFFTVFALVSWVLSVAPVLMLLEDRSAGSALAEGFHVGKLFASKLTEINLVMGIVKLALMVVAMVFSAAPLPFSDELGQEALHYVWFGAFLFYLVANDYFQVVRMKAFVEFWKVFRGSASGK